MSSHPPRNEAQKDDIVRCHAENTFLREKIHLVSIGCNPKGGIDSLFDVPEVQKIHQQRAEILNYVKDNYNIQTYEQLRDNAREIIQQRDVNRQFEQQLQQHYEPVPNHERPAEPHRTPPDFQQSISQSQPEQLTEQKKRLLLKTAIKTMFPVDTALTETLTLNRIKVIIGKNKHQLPIKILL